MDGVNMEKKKEQPKKPSLPSKAVGKFIAKVGGNLSDGKRFEAGDLLSNLTPSDLAALKAMDAISEE
jgi:hypothetical protein